MSSPFLQHAADAARGKIPADLRRSGEWPKARAAHLAKHPECAVCGERKKAEVHHIRPFHLHPELELDPANFITLCEDDDDGVNCHLFFGHLGNFKSFNVNIVNDAAYWQYKISHRPMEETPPGPNNPEVVK